MGRSKDKRIASFGTIIDCAFLGFLVYFRFSFFHGIA